MRLTNFYGQFRAVGVNYNQVTKARKNNFSERKALAFLNQLGKATLELVVINKKVMDLIRELRSNGCKISEGSSLCSVLAYDHQKINTGNAKVHFTNNMIEPRDGYFSIGICTQPKTAN